MTESDPRAAAPQQSPGPPSASGEAANSRPDETSGGFSGKFIRRPIATLMLTVAIVLLGALSYFSLPVAPLPTVDVATILVTADMSGADPQTNAFAVTNPLEKQFGQIPGLTQLTSSSANSYAEMTLQFGFNRKVDSVAGDVQAAITAAQADLPTQMAQPPIYRKSNPADTPVLILALTSESLPLTLIDDYAENILMQRISKVDGVGLITIGGQQQPAMRIELDPIKLAGIGLTLADARTAILAGTTITSKGVLEGLQKSVAVQANDQLVQQRDFDQVVIAYRNGAPVLVRDVGHAEIGPANTLLAGWFNHRRAIVLNVLLSNGANAIATVDAITKQLPSLRASLPKGAALSVVSDRTKTIRASVAGVKSTLLLTVVLVVITIFVFLRAVMATVIPGVAMLVALIGTLAVMRALGFSLDNFSLMALSISVGFVVDDAIVMIENISRHLEEGQDPRRAALQGAGEIGFTIMSISISLIAVFIPLFLMKGVLGKMLQEFAITVSAAILVSAFVSLTLTPTLCALLLKPEDKRAGHGRWYLMAEHLFDRLLAGYDRGLKFVLRHQFATLMVMLATVALTVVLYIVIPKGFFPVEDTGLISGISEAAQDVSIVELGQRQVAITDIILKDPAVDSVASYIGPGPSNAAPNQGRMFITLKPVNQRVGVQQVIARLTPQLQKVPGIRLFMQPTQDLTIGARAAKAMYQYTLEDADQGELSAYATRMLDRIRRIPGVVDATSDQEASGPFLVLDIDRGAAAQYGLTAQAIDESLNDAFGSRLATKVYGAFGQYFVIVEAAQPFRSGPDALNNLYLHGPGGHMVPLSSMARMTTRTGPIVVNHQNQLPSVTISFNLAPGVSIGSAVSAVQKIQAGLHFPLTLSGSFQGTANAYTTALEGETALIGAALVVIYLILGMLYESWSHPITILSTLPSAGLGALLMLLLVGLPFDVIGIIGVILLLGIVKKNGIMMVDFAIEQEKEGKSPTEAIYQACTLRFRPILMTTMCALLAGLPLIFASGIGSQLRHPLGYAIVGGLAVSQVLTLFTTPIIFIYIDKLASMLRRSHRGPASPGSVGAAP